MNSEVILFLVLSSSLLFSQVLFCVSLKRDEFAHEILVNIHYCCVIVEISAVILGAEYGNELLVLAEESISVFHHLMSTANQVKIMPLQEIF
jgi:hypothetical protein